MCADSLFKPETWKHLTGFVKIIPNGDILPTRGKYSVETNDWQVAVNHLYADTAKPTQQSELSRDRALHVLAAMRRDPNLSLSRAAKLEGVKPETVKKHLSSSLRRIAGKFTATKSDRQAATLYIPDEHGNPVPLPTRSSKERKQASNYLRDLGRYSRGQKNALAKWHGKKIAGVPLVTAGRTIVAIEPALSEFSLYRAFNGGAP